MRRIISNSFDLRLPSSNHLEELALPRVERVHGAADCASLLSTELLPFLTQSASQADGAASK